MQSAVGGGGGGGGGMHHPGGSRGGDRAARAGWRQPPGAGPGGGDCLPERTVLWNTYYSVVRFQFGVSVAAPVTTLSLPQGTEQRAFSYRINDALTTAGFDATAGNATEADTNLQTASQTVGGDLVEVHGISLMPGLTTDIELWKQLEVNAAVNLSMDGDSNRYRFGRMSFSPASGGIKGGGPTLVLSPPLSASLEMSYGWANGEPGIDNFRRFPHPFIWAPAGEVDSSLNIVIKVVRTITVVETARAAAGGPPITVQAYVPPTAVGQFGSFVDVMVRLHGRQIRPRSSNM